MLHGPHCMTYDPTVEDNNRIHSQSSSTHLGVHSLLLIITVIQCTYAAISVLPPSTFLERNA